MRLALLLLMLAGCAKPWQVARCVEWCETLKGGCGFEGFSYPMINSAPLVCECQCSARLDWVVEQQEIARHVDGGVSR